MRRADSKVVHTVAVEITDVGSARPMLDPNLGFILPSRAVVKSGPLLLQESRGRAVSAGYMAKDATRLTRPQCAKKKASCKTHESPLILKYE